MYFCYAKIFYGDNMKSGKLIILEGSCDGIGKSTQFEKLYERLVSDGYQVVRHHFPSYGTPNGNGVERYLSGEFGKISELSPYFINSLYAHDRAITWYDNLKKEYESGKIILLDRYTTSSLIYQSASIKSSDEKDKFLDYVIDFEYHKLGIKEPDLVIFLTMPFDMATEMRMQRKSNEGIINDIHEADLSFMKDVYDNALYVANKLDFSYVECSSENSIRSIDSIHEEVYSKCIKVLKK